MSAAAGAARVRIEKTAASVGFIAVSIPAQNSEPTVETDPSKMAAIGPTHDPTPVFDASEHYPYTLDAADDSLEASARALARRLPVHALSALPPQVSSSLTWRVDALSPAPKEAASTPTARMSVRGTSVAFAPPLAR